MTFDVVRHDTTVLLTINRPEKRNALTLPQLGELAEVIRGLSADPAMTGLVLTGRGAFCAGADLMSVVAQAKPALTASKTQSKRCRSRSSVRCSTSRSRRSPLWTGRRSASGWTSHLPATAGCSVPRAG